jgi:DNA invertase Pin-like site-specific DNA recombinase
MDGHPPGPGEPVGQDDELTPAAQYIRMSTDRQEYSTANQDAAHREYAALRRYRIDRTYQDEGRSGLRLEGRPGLARLLADVQGGNAPFKVILVYDVSRWGRFQDVDESAHYEYLCKKAGIRVEYCAEQFANDGSPYASLFKGMKRMMAAEYSRELSAKVFRGQCRLIQMGYRQGGPAGFGLRRMLLGQDGNEKGLLKKGEHKSLQTDRVVLVPGPGREVEVVRRIYDLFTRTGLKERDIADQLGREGAASPEGGRRWTPSAVRGILTNEKYIGNNVYNRRSFKLKQKRVRNAPSEWVRRDGAFPAVVEPETFFVARGIFIERSRGLSDEELVARLTALLAARGTLSAALIDGAEDVPSSGVYRHRFGSLIAAYALAGFRPDRDFAYIDINRHLRGLRDPLVAGVTAKMAEVGATVTRDGRAGVLLVNGQYTVDFLMTRCRQTPAGARRWIADAGRRPADVSVVVRMDVDNRDPVDFFLVPRTAGLPPRLRLSDENGAGIDNFQRDELDLLVEMADRVDAEEAA